MRIISGAARRHTLKVPHEVTRPTTDRTREAVFSIIAEHLKDALVLDLFCGSGAYGLEAISRGARYAHLVDHSRKAQEAVQANTSHPAFKEKSKFYCMEVDCALAVIATRVQAGFDLVFADPPYASSSDWASLETILPMAKLVALLSDGGLLILERSSESEDLELPRHGSALEMLDSRCYGSSRIEILRPG